MSIKRNLFLLLAALSLISPIWTSNPVGAIENKTLVVGGDYDYPPYSFLNDKGEPAGFDVDLIKAVADKMGVDVRFKFTHWADAIDNLKTGRVDLLLAVLYTRERTRYFDFTIPYNKDYYSIFYKKGTGIRDINDLQDKEVIMLKGDASIETFLKPLGLIKNITYANSYPEAFKLLLNGTQDYILAPFAIASYTLKEMEKQGIRVKDIQSTGETLIPCLYRLAIRKGNTALLTQLNDSLDALKSEDRIQNLHKRWFPKRPTSIPLSKVLQYVGIGLIPILVVILGIIFWSWSLKKQVIKKSETLKKAVEKAEQANLVKNRFLSNMNHEIRTPLNAISGFCQILIRQIEQRSLGEEILQIAKNIYSSEEKLADIISNLLEFSKIEAEKIQLKPESFNLKKNVQAVCGLYKVRALKQGVIFNFGLDSELPTYICSDQEKIKRILHILIGNALKFTPAGKSIWLKIKRENDSFLIQLEDEGIGINEKYLKMIFEPFKQVDDSVTKKYAGTGLGLAVAKAYVSLLKGEIVAHSQMDQGSVFTVKLPLVEPAAQGEQDTPL